MNVEIGIEAVQFPGKEYINWDFPCSVVRNKRGGDRDK